MSQQYFPLATVIYYGPDESLALKAVAAIIPVRDAEPSALRAWRTESLDIRRDAAIADEMLAFIKLHGAKQTVIGDGIWGCVHQTGVDYPEGEVCPHCPYWRDRENRGE